MIYTYIILGVMLAAMIVFGILRVTLWNKPLKKEKAFFDHADREFVDFTTSDGDEKRLQVAMTLVFQLEDGTELQFPVNGSFKGKVQEKQWGTLQYRGDRLIRFQCPSGKLVEKRSFFS